jgi:hypothetical protein
VNFIHSELIVSEKKNVGHYFLSNPRIKCKMGGTCSMHREYINEYSDLVSKREGNRPLEKSGGVKYLILLRRGLEHSFAPV